MKLSGWLMTALLCIMPFCGALAQIKLDAHLARITPQVQSWFEQIHCHPEVAKEEVTTSALVRAALREIGYTEFVTVDSLPTAVIAILETGKPGPTTCLRAELDAVSGVQDSTTLACKSEVAGVMHACGHSAHMAMLLGAADILWHEQEQLNGRVVFLFQPAEEAPGGANELVDWQVIERLGIDRMFALHCTSGLPVGEVQLAPGVAHAANRPFSLTVSGRGSHAAKPHEGDDVLTAACEIVSGLVSLPSRKLDVVHMPCIISVSRFQYGSDSTTGGVISPDVHVVGTIRSHTPVDSTPAGGVSIRTLAERHVENTAEAYGVTAKLSFKKGPPPTVNDPVLYEQVSAKLHDVWPEEQFSAGTPSMTSEDYAYYTNVVPCLYFRLGIAKDSLGYAPLHTSQFTVHPDALPWGVRLFVDLALISSQLPGAP